MKERVIYNAYYKTFKEFKDAVFGFFEELSKAHPDSVFGQELRRKIRDKLTPIQALCINF